MTRSFLAVMAISVSVPFSALADTIQIGEPTYGGTGCPAGSASVALSPDNEALSVLFDQYVVEAGGDTGKRLDRKNCAMAIPVHVPAGFSVAVLQADYRGYVAVPSGGNAVFSAEYFYAGATGPKFNRTFSGPYENDYYIENPVVVQTWTPCGKDVILRVNNSIRTQTNASKQQALATVDSVDIGPSMVFHLDWTFCDGGDGGWDNGSSNSAPFPQL